MIEARPIEPNSIQTLQKLSRTIDDLLEKAEAVRSLLFKGVPLERLSELTGHSISYLNQLVRLDESTSLTILLAKNAWISARVLVFFRSFNSAIKTEMLILRYLWMTHKSDLNDNPPLSTSQLSLITVDDRRIVGSQRDTLMAYLLKKQPERFLDYLDELFSDR
ncbi:MAG: hypothetical protein AAGM36_19135 [Cyanobacteria bacterium J06597_1]